MNPLSSLGPAGRSGVPPRLVLGALVTFVLAAPAVLLSAWPAATELLAFDRGRIADGEWWRMVTCHWTHWTLDHLGWDLLAFTVLVPLCWRIRPARLGWTLALSSLLIPLVLWYGLPAMTQYRGLSGLDSALFVLLASRLLRGAVADRDHGAILLLGLPFVAFAAKIGFEWITGQAVFADSGGFVPVPLAHVVGGACGVLVAWARPPGRHRVQAASYRTWNPA
jgi:rhomboid family GlyGly-CTERM serine protease